MKYKIVHNEVTYEYESLKIAIVKLSAMGDIIHAMVALQFLKKFDPTLQIDWIVEESFYQVLENNPHITNIYTLNLKSIKKNPLKIFNQISKLKGYSKNKYDLVIDAQGLIKSAISAYLLGDNIAGFSRESIREKLATIFYTDYVNIAYDANTIDRNVTVIGKPLGFSITSKMILEKEPFLYYKDEDTIIYDFLDSDKKNIVFVIGSTWESRNYPKEKFLKIADELKENCIVVWGSENEKEKALWLEKESQNIKALPKINLNSLKAIISKSDLVIGNDTGPTHMAWALNIPSVTIFGPTPINRIYQTSINKIVKSNSEVNHFKLDKNDFSINEIDENEIIQEANNLLYG